MTDTIQNQQISSPEITVNLTGHADIDDQVVEFSSVIQHDPKFAIRALGIIVKPSNTLEAVLSIFDERQADGMKHLQILTKGWKNHADTQLSFDDATNDAIYDSDSVKKILKEPDTEKQPSKSEKLRLEGIQIALSRLAIHQKLQATNS